MPNINVNISETLTSDEKEIIALLDRVVKEKSPGTSPRIAGGWVRDHLLGVPSDDIDVMTDNISGAAFAKMVAETIGGKTPHVFKVNPAKSKHLETAEIQIPTSSGKTYTLQFAGARKDTYSENSRVPIIEAATPTEDALRRDLTINSMFYNLKTKQVEDLTGKGIKDLITNTIRTPVEPLKTFTDDPLRIFRTIRFAAKYKGEIDPETYAALKNPVLKDSLKNKDKISPERIGLELKKTMANPNSDLALSLLKETGLLSDIIEISLKGTKYEGKMEQLEMEQDNPNHKLNLWEHTMQVVSNTLSKYQNAEGEQKIVMTLGALFHDLGKLFSDIRKKKEGTDKYPGHEKGYTTYVGHEEESAEIAKSILKYLKLDPYIQQVSGLARYHMQPHSLVRDDVSGAKALRKFIRRMGEMSLNWLDVFNLSVADAYSKDKNIDPNTIKDYQDLEKRLQDALASMSTTTETKIKPVLDGNDVMRILNIKPGPHMKDVTEFIKDLQDENPSISKEEAERKIKEKFGYLSPQSVTPTAETQNVQDEQVKHAAVDSEKRKTSTCPKHLFNQKVKDLREMLAENKLFEANSVMNQLKDEYGKDEFIARLIAITSLKVIIKDEKFRDNSILQYIFDRARENFFDYILGAYAIGILLMIDTATNETVIKEVAERTSKLSPGIMKSVMDMIPSDRIFKKECYGYIRELLSGNNKNE